MLPSAEPRLTLTMEEEYLFLCKAPGLVKLGKGPGGLRYWAEGLVVPGPGLPDVAGACTVVAILSRPEGSVTTVSILGGVPAPL